MGNSGVAAFSRDAETASQVWSAETGYDGDPVYREFYRDLGYNCDYEYIRTYLHSDGIRRNIGVKYHKITGKVALGDKHSYVPRQARITVKGIPKVWQEKRFLLGARIIAVIDACDAMTSDRPYRKALGKEYAISELEKGMNAQFDPKVAKVFIDILKSKTTVSV